MTFDLTVLGCAGSHTGPGRACSGYLVRDDDTQLLLDCGNGASANLQRITRPEDLDAILITHRHVDHCVDLIGMFYALRFGPQGPRAVDLYAAPEVVDTLTGLLSRDSAQEFKEVFHVTEVTGGDRFEVGPLQVELADSIHPVPTVSVKVSAGDRNLVYSSDSAGGEQLRELAHGTDLFLCEATWQGDAPDHPPGMHLTARQAGQLATEAEVRRLVLTHVLGSLDRSRSLAEARETFAGDLALADDLRSWLLA
ncbi:MBL fold metallo-hydrolase [Nitriliruptoraceae bacterium ZYF776]|nr:MBL fold metallo-hydrolase [Profundirhabdus halotolerans]